MAAGWYFIRFFNLRLTVNVSGALSYAELGTHIPISGAEYAYLGHAFGNLHPVIGPLPAFLFSWINMVDLLKVRSTDDLFIFLMFAKRLDARIFELSNWPQCILGAAETSSSGYYHLSFRHIHPWTHPWQLSQLRRSSQMSRCSSYL